MLLNSRKLKKRKGLILIPVAWLAQPCLAEDSDPNLAITPLAVINTQREFWVLTTERIAISIKSIFTSRGSFRFILGRMCACSLL